MMPAKKFKRDYTKSYLCDIGEHEYCDGFIHTYGKDIPCGCECHKKKNGDKK